MTEPPKDRSFRFDAVTAPAIRLAALTSGLDANLLAAIVWQESRGYRRAIRYEPAYRWLWDTTAGHPFRRLTDEERAADVPPADFNAAAGADPLDEWCGQRTSWGLCQVMGATARQLGFKGPSFYALWQPAPNLELGSAYLAKLIRKWDLADAVSAYNAGSPGDGNEESYVRPVLRQMAAFEKGGFG